MLNALITVIAAIFVVAIAIASSMVSLTASAQLFYQGPAGPPGPSGKSAPTFNISVRHEEGEVLSRRNRTEYCHMRF